MKCSCGANNPDGAAYCVVCGASLNGTSAYDTLRPDETGNTDSFWGVQSNSQPGYAPAQNQPTMADPTDPFLDGMQDPFAPGPMNPPVPVSPVRKGGSGGVLLQLVTMCAVTGLLLLLIGIAGKIGMELVMNSVKDSLAEEVAYYLGESEAAELVTGRMYGEAKELIIGAIKDDPEKVEQIINDFIKVCMNVTEEDPFTEQIAAFFVEELMNEVYDEARSELISAVGLYWPLAQIAAYHATFLLWGMILLAAGVAAFLLLKLRLNGFPWPGALASLPVTLLLVILIAHIDVIGFVRQVSETVKTQPAVTETATPEPATPTPTSTPTPTPTPTLMPTTPPPTPTPTPTLPGPTTVPPSSQQNFVPAPLPDPPTPNPVTPTPNRVTPTPYSAWYGWGGGSSGGSVPSSRYPLFDVSRRINPVGRTVEISVSSGHGRGGPGMDSPSVAYVNRGERYTVYACELGDTGKDWYQIRVDGQTCWVSSGLVMIDGYLDGTVEGVPIVPELTDRQCTIRSTQATIRSGPGTNYASVGSVSSGQTYDILDWTLGPEGLDWYKISCGGRLCWVRSDLVYLSGYGGGTVEGVLIDPYAYR